MFQEVLQALNERYDYLICLGDLVDCGPSLERRYSFCGRAPRSSSAGTTIGGGRGNGVFGAELFRLAGRDLAGTL